MLLERLFTREKALVNHCPRCDGLLVGARLAYEDCEQWACANCGERRDAHREDRIQIASGITHALASCAHGGSYELARYA